MSLPADPWIQGSVTIYGVPGQERGIYPNGFMFIFGEMENGVFRGYQTVYTTNGTTTKVHVYWAGVGETIAYRCHGVYEGVGYDSGPIEAVLRRWHMAGARFDYKAPAPEPGRQYALSVTVEADMPDPGYVGEYWVQHPEEIPIVRRALQGVKATLKEGFAIIAEELTNVSGEFRANLYDGTYSLTLSMNGYETITDTIIIAGDRLMKTYFMMPAAPGFEAFDIKSIFDEYLTVGNIAKSGAVIMLVYAGSKAFKEFKETFKRQ